MNILHFIHQNGYSVGGSELAPSVLAYIVLIVISVIIAITLIAFFVNLQHFSSFGGIYKLAGASVVAWVALAWMGSSYYTANMADSAYRNAVAQAYQQARGVADDINDAITILRGIPQVMVTEDVVHKQLERFGPESKASALAYDNA